jgi:hypothetical protein
MRSPVVMAKSFACRRSAAYEPAFPARCLQGNQPQSLDAAFKFVGVSCAPVDAMLKSLSRIA